MAAWNKQHQCSSYAEIVVQQLEHFGLVCAIKYEQRMRATGSGRPTVDGVQRLREALMNNIATSSHALPALCAHCRLDTFTARLLGILRSSRTRRAELAAMGRPEVSLGIHRSDYMLDAPSQGFLQVRILWLQTCIQVTTGASRCAFLRYTALKTCRF